MVNKDFQYTKYVENVLKMWNHGIINNWYITSNSASDIACSVQFSSVQFAKINVVLTAKRFRTTTQ